MNLTINYLNEVIFRINSLIKDLDYLIDLEKMAHDTKDIDSTEYTTSSDLRDSLLSYVSYLDDIISHLS